MKLLKLIILFVFVLIILFVPIRSVFDDGGTVAYAALTYEIIYWHRMYSVVNSDGTTEIKFYKDVDFYIFPNNFKDNINKNVWDLIKE